MTGLGGWWRDGLALAAGVLALVLAVWLPVAAARRWAPPHRRAVTASVGAAVALGGCLVVLSSIAVAA